jgi:hypothetical protein
MTEKDAVQKLTEERLDEEARARREFLTKAVQGATVIPAAALLLAATSKPASAQQTYNGGGCGCGCGCA